jgi:hypothetical protein
MANAIEIRTTQKSSLFKLLKLEIENKKAGIEVKGLYELIIETKTVMEAEDVAYVEKMIAELK